MQIHLPNSAFLGNIDSFIRNFDPKNPERLIITANKKWISVHPVVLAMIASLGRVVAPENIQCEAFEAKSKNYFERMGLFQFLGIQSGIDIHKHEATGRFIPLTQIKTAEELSHFIKEMTPLLHLEPKHAEPIRYVVSELVRNTLEHSLSKEGAIIAAQYYKKTKTIRLGIVDTGVGIWKTINNAYNPKKDIDAIQLALIPGVTGTTKKIGGTETNAGAGLFFIKSIASVNRNFMMIYSGYGMYKLLKRKSEKVKLHWDPFKDKHAKHNDMPFWQGTIVGIDITLETTKEFAELLDLIKKTLSEGIRERKKERYRKPKFI